MTRVAFVIHILRMQGIEVGRAKSALKLSDGEYPAGSFMVKTNQPYGPLAKTLLGKQDDPDPDLRTYDDCAWTMGLMTNTEIKPTKDIAVQAVAVDPVDEFTPEGTLKDVAAAAVYAVPDHGSPNMATLRYALKDVAIQIAEKPFTAGGATFPAGTFLIPASAASALKPLATQTGPRCFRPRRLSQSRRARIQAPAPRYLQHLGRHAGRGLGPLHASISTKSPTTSSLRSASCRANLAKDYDLILIPTQARSAKDLVFDIPKCDKPLAYEKTALFKFLGDYGSSDDISGGMGGGGRRRVPEVRRSRRHARHSRRIQRVSAGLRPHARHRNQQHRRKVLRPRPHC